MKRTVNLLFLVVGLNTLMSSAQTPGKDNNILSYGDSLFNNVVIVPKKITKEEFDQCKKLNNIKCRIDSSGFISGYGLYRTDTCYEICQNYLVENKSGRKMWLPSSYDAGINGLLLSPSCNQFIVYSSYDGPDYKNYYEYRAEISGFTVASGEGLETIKTSFNFSTTDWSIEDIAWASDNSLAIQTYSERKTEVNNNYNYFKITIGQSLSCEELTNSQKQKLLHLRYFPHKQHLWHNDSISPYCMGKYFAQKDIDSNIFKIQTLDNLNEENNLWKVCRYEQHGFKLYHQPDFVQNSYYHMDEIKEFMAGYNEISKAYLKSIIGDSAYAHIDDVPNDFFNYGEFLHHKLQDNNYKKYFVASPINDTTVNVKLMVDSLFKEEKRFISQVEYIIICDYMDTPRPSAQLMNYKEITKKGFRLTEYSKGIYYFEIQFYFRVKPSYWCQTMDIITYNYIFPLFIKQ